MKRIVLCIALMVWAVVAAAQSPTKTLQQQISSLALVGYAANQPKPGAAAPALLAAPLALADGNPCTNLGVVISENPAVNAIVTYQTCTGYFYQADISSGLVVIPPAGYASFDCSGPAVAIVGFQSPQMQSQGWVFRQFDGTFVYLPAGEADSIVTINSESSIGFCFQFTGDVDSWGVLANDPAVTGVSNVGLALPITNGPPQ